MKAITRVDLSKYCPGLIKGQVVEIIDLIEIEVYAGPATALACCWIDENRKSHIIPIFSESLDFLENE